MTKILIKPIEFTEISQVLELDQLCFGGLWSQSGYEQEIDSEDSLLLGMYDDHVLIGITCCWLILDEAHITLLGIHPDYRQQGLGKHLLKVLLDTAKNKGILRATLEVRISNEVAIALYHKLGFNDVGLRKNYYQNPDENALIMWSKLTIYPRPQATI
ncbi:MAG TPA: ribosomal protein S18-alanine N-acetyltransferase [Allocoleopsis sp.]